MGCHCYCAICGASITEIDIGSRSDKAQRIRKRVVINGHRRRARETSSEARRESYIESESDDGSDICAAEHSYTIKHAYDPEVIDGHETSWITEFLLVANDPRKKEAPRTFFCGPARYGDYNFCDGPNGPPLFPHYDYDELPLYRAEAYWDYEDPRLGSFPCHVKCLKILSKVVTGAFEIELLDPYVLHQAMLSFTDECTFNMLNIGYGDISGADQDWECYPGEEFSVIDPLEELPLNEETINEFILDDEASPEDPQGNMTECIRRDPFQTLPAELIHRTMDFLEGHDIFAFREASPFARDATSNSTFWKSLLRREQKWLWGSIFDPDFWESRSLTKTQSVDWERLLRPKARPDQTEDETKLNSSTISPIHQLNNALTTPPHTPIAARNIPSRPNEIKPLRQ
ncbi:hypothetical protein Q7P37_008277 [Cladosporium fusiforme]